MIDPHLFQSCSLPMPTQIKSLSGGANNRIYKLEFQDRSPLVLKQYFQHAQDLRPRLDSEFSFLQYAWDIGIRSIPEPLFTIKYKNIALFSYIPASPFQKEKIDEPLIDQLIQFFLQLNKQKNRATQLNRASEACFSLEDYLKVSESRIARLSKHFYQSSIEKEVETFLHQELIPTWETLQYECKAALSSLPPLDQNELCVSPSDFGFHNTLLQDQKLFFLDFEYAGWDDPCKTVCDLFCQPKFPIPHRFFNKIVEAFSTCVSDQKFFFERIKIFYPIIQIKWCTILLNAFTKVGKERRFFSKSDELNHLENQLTLAKLQLKEIYGISRLHFIHT